MAFRCRSIFLKRHEVEEMVNSKGINLFYNSIEDGKPVAVSGK